MQANIDLVTNRYSYSLQGVVRCKLSIEELRTIILTLKENIEAYIVVTEDLNKDTEHHHFVLQSNRKQLNVYRTRKHFKECIKLLGKAPKDYVNGDCNITKVRDIIQMITYLTKQGIPQIIHNYPKSLVEQLSKHSFEKKISMTKAITALKELLYHSQIDLEEYIIRYRLLRNAYKKPDPLWYKEYTRMLELTHTEEYIRKEVRNFHSNFNVGYS